MSIDLKKKYIIDLSKKASFSINQKGIENLKAQVVLVLDISKSMNSLYKSGVIQNVIERILALALNFDDDGSIDIFLFGTNAYSLPSVTINDFDNYVQNIILTKYKINEATNYAPPLKLIYDKYCGKQSVPVFVIFITDGGNADKKETENIIRPISSEPIFIQFVGIGADDFPFLRKLDQLTGRVIDNAGFMEVNDISNIKDKELYDRLLNEFPQWLNNAKEKKIIK
ncbi:MAG: VWA domain-containing protein [Desulfobacterales bacterium]|nr:VWA domain-containing protein [Desulfobacterales bacterium]